MTIIYSGNREILTKSLRISKELHLNWTLYGLCIVIVQKKVMVISKDFWLYIDIVRKWC